LAVEAVRVAWADFAGCVAALATPAPVTKRPSATAVGTPIILDIFFLGEFI
jgi:hypothetical protein